MSLIRSIEAKFVAQARGLKSTIQGVKKDINTLHRDTRNASSGMNKNFSNLQTGIQKSMYKASDTLSQFSVGMRDVSRKVEDTGRSLTNKITKPAMIATTAAVGLVGALGFKRLVGLDTAQAKLKGLGYSAQDVERISKQVETAIEGGMTTMGEGVDIAAGGLAAGVKEGKDLERYIKLVGDAAVGANRPVGEMAQIFHRVQGGGRLMTQELNMIEMGLPGFSQAMADEVAGGSLEAFRDMVTNGEVGSDEFLDVMDDFAGGMADAYSESWAGMAKNALAYTGIIGESLLEGAFEEGKKSLAEFIELLKSDEVQAWAKRVGEMIRVIFTEVVEKVKSGVEWFRNLSNSQQKMIVKLGALAVAAGPVLLVLGKLGGAVASISSGFSVLLKWLAPVITPIKSLGKFAGGSGKSVGLLGRAIKGLTSPVGLAITIITLLTTAFTVAYKKSETFRNFIDRLGEKIKEVFFAIVDWMRPGFDAVLSFFGEIKTKISEFANEEGPSLIEAFQNIWDFVSPILGWIADKVKWAFDTVIKPVIGLAMKVVQSVIKMVWGNIKGIITGTLDVIMGAVKIFSGLFTGDFSKMWEGVKQLFFGAIKVIWNWIQLQFIGRILKGIGVFIKSFGGFISKMWSGTKTTFLNGIKAVWEWMKNSFIGRIIASIINFAKNFRTNLSKMWTLVKSLFKQRIAEIRESVANSFVGRIIKNIINFAKNFRTHLSNMWTKVKSLFTKRISEIYQSVKNSFVGRIISNIINFAKNFRTNISNMWTSVKSIFSKWIGNIRNSIANSFVGRMLSSVRSLKTNFVKIAKEMWQGVKRQFGNIVDGAKALPGRIGRGISGAKSKAVNAMKGVGNNLITWAGKPFNKVVGGVNWITGKLGIKKKIPTWSYPQYAKGTSKRGHPGGPAMVNDGRGKLKGQELIVLPDGSTGMFEGEDVVANLPKGAHVFSAPDTRDMLNDVPQYAKGTDSTQDFLGKGSNMVGGSAKKRTWKDKVWDYIKKPSKLLDIALDKFGAKLPKNTAMFKDMLKGGFNTIKDAALDKVKSTFKKQEKTEHNPNYFPSGGMLLGASGGSRSVSNPWGVHDYLYNIAKHIMRSPLGRGLIITSGYRSTSNTDHGKRNAIDLSGFGRNGGYGAVARWASRLPRVSYTIGDNVVYGRKYGDGGRPSWARGHMNHLHVSGYEDGGIINTKQLAWIAEGGWAESIISHDPAKYNSQKAIWQKTGDALGFTDNENTKKILAELERIAKAVESGDSKLFDIFKKESTIIMDHTKVGEVMDKEQGKRTNLAGRVAH